MALSHHYSAGDDDSVAESSVGSSPALPQHQGEAPETFQAQHMQTLAARGGAVLAVAYSASYIFSGTQGGAIHAWRRDTFRLARTLPAHAGGCHSLAVDAAGGILYSGGGDGRVRAWDMRRLQCLFVVHAGVNSGAVLALAVLPGPGLLVLGCQNTSLQWFDVRARDAAANRDEVRRELAARQSRFFAAKPSGSGSPRRSGGSSGSDSGHEEEEEEEGGTEEFVIAQQNTIAFAHSGYVYSLAVDGGVVYSGGSDGVVRAWRLAGRGLAPMAGLEPATGDACVHALVADDGLLYAALQSGGIDVWDVETRQRVRTLPAHGRANVFALARCHGAVVSAGADGAVRAWGRDQQPVGWVARPTTRSAALNPSADSVLALAAAPDGVLIVGRADGSVGVWDVAGEEAAALPAAVGSAEDPLADRRLVATLAQWIRFRSVSGVAELQPECRRAARFLRDTALRLGASDARLISSTAGTNPIVYARFGASDDQSRELDQTTESIFVYGHYDVMPAGDAARWLSAPFELSGRDGRLYARGATDNKGPVLATLFAVAALARSKQLPLPVVFCIEGEEESGSAGLHAAVAAHRALFGRPRVVLLSSSYWLGDATPCLTYGMRGSIRASLRVESERQRDVHSGVWGGAVAEPLAALAHVLAALVSPAGDVLVPGFSDAVRPVAPGERDAMARLIQSAPDHHHSPDALLRRWRLPALSVHHVDVSTVAAPGNATLVPAAAHAALSVRVVPDQSLEDVAELLRAHVTRVFNAYTREQPLLGDALHLSLDVTPVANWWLADPNAPVFRAAARAIREEWNMDSDPLLIREGGSIPAVPWLEAFFAPDAVVVNLPMGQASDNAHLDNERISLENLLRGRQVVWRLLKDIKSVLEE
ncbi:hypothetical protein H4R26_003261 [Coemansia thaxteri]|uniref:Peptidase M20 dimerisation domain-containing protein n=1 Tax=Coemansia thaxteri TaxID=2663907 RepID=A0A9W8BBH4_9FUNG|nr:hypothetical protein H4R26_003261 [Coemansia thaxteri]